MKGDMAKNKVIMNGGVTKVEISGFKTVTIEGNKIITIMNHDLTHCSGIWYDENDEPKVCERRQECHRYEAWLALEQDEKHLPKGYIIPFLKGEECVRTGYSQMWTREHSGNQHDETDVFEHVSSGMGVDDEKVVEKIVRKGGAE